MKPSKFMCGYNGVLILLFFLSLPVLSQGDGHGRVLFLGNSVFYYQGGVYQSFGGFCQAEGLSVQSISQRKQPEYTHGVEFLGYGRIPLNLPDVAADEKIQELIRSGRFDYVVLEARRHGYLLPDWIDRPEELNRGQSIPYQQNIAALGKLHRTIVESGAKTVLYMHPGLHTLPDWKHPLAQIYERLRADLEDMEIHGAYHEVILVPASLFWIDAVNRYGEAVWYADPGHGTSLARYASGCMLFTYLTGKDPRKNEFRELPLPWNVRPDVPTEYVSEMDANWIKDQVWLYYTTRFK